MGRERVRSPAGWIALGSVVLLAGVSTARAQEAGSTFRDCDDCPEMAVLPAGTFMMGTDKQSEDVPDTETPRHKVTIGRPFAIGKYEVTQAEWEALMDDNPSPFGGPSHPVVRVSWDGARLFIQRLNAKTGQAYRLPTEAEWEYAARAGTETTWSWGGDGNMAGDYAWYDGNAGGETHPVGQLRPNGFGLHDMHGNVFEWVEDCWHHTFIGAPTDGGAWTFEGCKSRVQRGGSWSIGPWFHRSAFRHFFLSDGNYYFSGFRVARDVSLY